MIRALLIASAGIWSAAASAQDTARQVFALHAQGTLVAQGNTAFDAPYDGPNSLRSDGELRETGDLTLYAGASPWEGAEIWLNPEVDQGFGLANTTGAAGFPSGEAYKVGRASPYLRLQRAFVRQTIDLGGDATPFAADLNQLRGRHRADRIVLTFGKMSVGDVFDTNALAHDPRNDFLNWALIEAGAFDYAADAWGYSIGGTAEWYHGRWTLRGGLFNLSDVPNSERLNRDFSQYQALGEVEERHSIAGRPGRIRLTGWFSHGRMARLDDAIAYGAANGTAPDPAAVRRFATRAGALIGVEQEIATDIGLFARASIADDRYESFEFTDIDRSVSGGVSIGGARWGRAADRIGLGVAANMIGAPRRAYLADGGLGILVGDGRLIRYGAEHVVEGWYRLAVTAHCQITADAQLIDAPGYNRDRGPVPVFALRLHEQL